MIKLMELLLFSNLYYLINYSKTNYINNNTNIYKSQKFHETLGFLRFLEIYLSLEKTNPLYITFYNVYYRK